MMPHSFPLLGVALLLGCGVADQEHAVSEQREARLDTTVVRPAAAPAPVEDSIPAVQPPAPARVSVTEQEGCEDYINATSEGVRMICYTRPERMLAREAEIPSMLESAWQLAWQGAPRSIADDFEHGTSTEHVHMPDTLDVEVRHYSDCRAKQPFAVRNYRVWRNPAAGLAWRNL